MLDDLLTLIPARGGSKGIPGKNVRELNGRPLIWYAIDNAREAGLDPVVSTDDPRIARAAADAGARALTRPPELASCDAPLWRVCQYHSEGRAVLCLPPTCPFLKPETIRRAIERLGDTVVTTDCVVAMAEMPAHSSLAWPGYMELWKPVYPRQKRREELYPTGALFLRTAELLENPRGENCFGDSPRGVLTTPIEALNIDTEYDWEICEALKASGLY